MSGQDVPTSPYYFTAQAKASGRDYVIVDDTYAHISTKEGKHIKIEKELNSSFGEEKSDEKYISEYHEKGR